jgi:hypothetical protein
MIVFDCYVDDKNKGLIIAFLVYSEVIQKVDREPTIWPLSFQ